MKPLVYTAGPITGCNFKEATGWRDFVRENLQKCGIYTLSPMRGKKILPPSETYDAAIIKSVPDALSSPNGINIRDYNDVKRADLIFVNLLGAKTVSIGTVMEIAWARAFGKPVVLVMEKGNVHDHCMLKFPCGFIVENIGDAIEITRQILLTDNQLEYYE